MGERYQAASALRGAIVNVMKTLWPCALMLLTACPSVSGSSFGSDTPLLRADLPDASLFVQYEGRLRVEPEEPVSFVLAEGELPAGLSLGEDGQISGVPQWLGSTSSIVVGTRNTGESLSLEIEVTVVPGPDEVFGGFPRNPHLAPAGDELLGDLWLRIAGGGVPGQDSLLFAPGLYVAGPDGVAQGGGGDDVRVFDLTVGVDVGLGIAQWNPSNPSDTSDPPSWDESTSTWTSGGQAGRRSLTFSPEGYEPEAIFLGVVPPDWCPEGEHPRGGPSPGFCQ